MSAPTRKTTDLVDKRDGYCCFRCGAFFTQVEGGSRHHRKSRRDGDHSVANLVLLCGSGTTGCHGWAHKHVSAAKAVGLIIPVNSRPPISPAGVPLFRRADLEWVEFTASGAAVPISPVEAERRMTAVYGDEWVAWMAEAA